MQDSQTESKMRILCEKFGKIFLENVNKNLLHKKRRTRAERER
jgi:hypothetical protein